MFSPEISVIVPVYQAEIFLPECVESLLDQTYENFEILLIDDGSSDNSGAICDKFALEDKRIRVFHKINGGVSSARNTGLLNARGKYVCFVDADDCMDKTCFADSLEVAKEFDADVIQFGYRRISKKGIYQDFTPPARWTYSCLEFYHESGSYQPAAWGYLFKRVLLADSLFFSEEIRFGEDQEFTLKALFNANNIATLNKVYYFYRENTLSATSQQIDYETALDHLKVVKNLFQFITEKHKGPLSVFYAEAIIRLIKAYLIKVAQMPLSFSLYRDANRDFKSLYNEYGKLFPGVFNNTLFNVCKKNVLPYLIYIKWLLSRKK